MEISRHFSIIHVSKPEHPIGQQQNASAFLAFALVSQQCDSYQLSLLKSNDYITLWTVWSSDCHFVVLKTSVTVELQGYLGRHQDGVQGLPEGHHCGADGPTLLPMSGMKWVLVLEFQFPLLKRAYSPIRLMVPRFCPSNIEQISRPKHFPNNFCYKAM